MSEHVQQFITLTNLRAMRETILAIAQRNHASNVRVFGSVARGTNSPVSDVDFLVTFALGASLYDLSGIVLDLQELLGCRVDVADDQTPDTAFLQRIAPDLVAL